MNCMPDLYEIAMHFRASIEESRIHENLTALEKFPAGCCSYASSLLQQYLIEEYQIHTVYMSGRFDADETQESHAWLETKDGIVIDITGDQYKYNAELEYDKSVYVGPREDGFHDRFVLDEPVCFSKEQDPFGVKSEYEKLYEIVIKYCQM